MYNLHSRFVPSLLAVLLVLLFLPAPTRAQAGDRDARAAKWESYALPEGEYLRHADAENGYVLWYPASWKPYPQSATGLMFKPSPQGTNLYAYTEPIPDGLGVANLTSSVLQALRNQRVSMDTLIVRRAFLGGLEWRELTYTIDAPGGTTVHQTMWLTALGAKAHSFVLSAQPEEMERHEPTFKRMLLSLRLMPKGRWTVEFERARARIVEGRALPAGREVEAARLAEALRTGQLAVEAALPRMEELARRAPDVVWDLTADAEPMARAAALTALARAENAEVERALVWALEDADAMIASTAASLLAARGEAGTKAATAVLNPFATLSAEQVRGMIRLGLALEPAQARDWVADLLRSEDAHRQVAAVRIAIERPETPALLDSLPYARLLRASNAALQTATIAALTRLDGARAEVVSADLLPLLAGDSEMAAVRALAEIGPPALADRFSKRVADLDARLGVEPRPAPGPARKKRGGTPTELPTDWMARPEPTRLGYLREQLDIAVRKIRFRGRWSQARDDDARRRLLAEARKDDDLSVWADALNADRAAAAATVAPTGFDSSPWRNAPTTGETLFPQTTFSYASAPDFAGTMGRIDAALTGVQMATVRDQMTFTLMLKLVKGRLAEKLGADLTGDVGKAIGVDLGAPVSIASWPGEAASARHAAILRVTDRSRFERLLQTYQRDLGSFETFFSMTPALARFASVLPAVLPAALASFASEEAQGKWVDRIRLPHAAAEDLPALAAFTRIRRERIGDLPVTLLSKTIVSPPGVRREEICVAYFGETAVVAPSKAALLDLLRGAASGRPALARSAAYAQARRERGEIVFFSRLGDLLAPLLAAASPAGANDAVGGFLGALGAEIGALHLSPTSWETNFRLDLREEALTRSLKPFSAAALAAPKDLLPAGTVLYAGAMVDPKAIGEWLRQEKTAGQTPRDRELLEGLEQHLLPAMSGEIAAAVLSLKPFLGPADWPAMALAIRLSSAAPAAAHRAGTLFPGRRRVPNAMVLGSPVTAFGEEEDAVVGIVTDGYLILADSLDTLKRLDAAPGAKFASTRDFQRSLKDAPENLALFTTYNLESAFEESSQAIRDSFAMQQLLPLASAISHAFHSERAYFTMESGGVRGRLAVAFDREGGYSIGELARQADDFDIANAILAPKGLRILGASRVESMTLRITARQAGILQRLKDDLAKFPWQRIAPGAAAALTVTTEARRLPEKLTMALPASDTSLAPFLSPTSRINSTAPQIVALARQIAGNDRDGRSVARKIGEWTYQNLTWKKVESDSVGTLASREADCLEHSELYVALARALGLPARVVTGAALSDGAFGSHAWVEIYLGRWVEIDPTWGLLDHVDATHLRFDGDAFPSYAMLNQIEVEIAAARRATAEFQRTPVDLVETFNESNDTAAYAFDVSLILDQALGRGAWEKLDDRQRAAAVSAVEKTARELSAADASGEPPLARILRNEQKPTRAVLTALMGDSLVRFHLAARDGAWFIVEYEDLDVGLPRFADAVRGALEPARARGQLLDAFDDRALARLDQLIAREGESPDLLLLKARLQENRQSAALNEQLFARLQQKEAAQSPAAAAATTASDLTLDTLKRITARWPEFAPAQLMLGRYLLFHSEDRNAIEPLEKDAAAGIQALERYARLVPYDPRPHADITTAYRSLRQLDKAEAALRKAIQLDPEHLPYRAELVELLLASEQPTRARIAFTQLIKSAGDAEEAFDQLASRYEPEDLNEDDAKALETLVLAFPRELASSKTALTLLSRVQSIQNKTAEAIKSAQRLVTIDPEPGDYDYLSNLYRQARRFPEALTAADEALKLDAKYASAYFERACSLAQLGRKREAIAALRQMLDLDQDISFDADDPDLQPLAALPEYRALKEKLKKPADPREEKEK